MIASCRTKSRRHEEYTAVQSMDRIKVTAHPVEYPSQAAQPDADHDWTLADHDLDYLCGFLATLRGQTYELLMRPDITIRNASAPDYLVLENPSSRRIAVEHTRFMDQTRQATKAGMLRQGAGTIVDGPRSIDPFAVCDALAQFLERKLGRTQASGIAADERILLIRNRVLATSRTFASVSLPLSTPARVAVDHCYLIASSQLLELW